LSINRLLTVCFREFTHGCAYWGVVMADVFISYKREDRPAAERLARALEQLGFDVWYDFELLSGDQYRHVIKAIIDQCKAAVVLWSRLSVESDFVLDEASYAKDLNKICPARIDDVQPLPFGFGGVHTDDLRGWNGQMTHEGFQRLLKTLEGKVGRAGELGAKPPAGFEDARAELEAFKAAAAANNRAALETYIKKWPRGRFRAFAEAQMKDLAPRVQPAATGAPAGFQPAVGASARPSYEPEPAPKGPNRGLVMGGVVAVLLAAGGVYAVIRPQETPSVVEVPGGGKPISITNAAVIDRMVGRWSLPDGACKDGLVVQKDGESLKITVGDLEIIHAVESQSADRVDTLIAVPLELQGEGFAFNMKPGDDRKLEVTSKKGGQTDTWTKCDGV
jgi:hypothetical protein